MIGPEPVRTRYLTWVACLVACLSLAVEGFAANEARIASPDGLIQARVFVREGRLHYEVAFRDRPVIETSPLIVMVDGVDLTEGIDLGEVQRYDLHESYPWRGVHDRAVNHCNGITIAVRHAKTSSLCTVELRAFKDGVAFRHIVPGGKGPRVPDEATRFTLPAGCTVWYHDLHGHYEGVHDRKDIAGVKAGEWAAPPLTVKLPNGAGYAAITEAALVNYSGMALQADGRRGFSVVLGHKHPVSYPFELRYKEDIARLARPAAVTGPIVSPWRVVLVGADLNALVNSDVIHNLCPPPDPRLFPKGIHTDWLKPGRAVWKYLDGGESTLAGMKEFCRLAGELGFEHHVIEGFWRRWSDAELRELVEHGKRHGVGIWLWKHTKELRDAEARRAFFQKCRAVGAAGVKLDFFDHEAREIIDLYHVLLREAAESKLMVCFHGSNKPTGEPRTWPNEMLRESIKGMEASKLKTRARHNATLPFTRFLAGHADYTPVHFGPRRGDTTWAHQVASAVVFTAPLLTYAAHPRTLLDNPCTSMLRSIPAVWDETVVLPLSEIGELAAFARRSGDTWFLALLNGPAGRTVRIPLSFLGEGKYRALLLRDRNDDPAVVRLEETAAQRSDTLTIELSDGGGFIARFFRN